VGEVTIKGGFMRIVRVSRVIEDNDFVTKDQGQKLFDAIQNALTKTKCKVLVDFSGVHIMTSEAACNSIGKLISDLTKYNEKIRCINVNRYHYDLLKRVKEVAYRYYYKQQEEKEKI
jgi:hypothetical protein